MKTETKPLAIIVLVSTVLGIGFCLWRITKSPSANEALLLSLFMTVLSILASWIVSRYYAQASYEDNLKVFALKAAEKVTNLSNELDRLSIFLQKALDEEDFSSPNDELLAKTIRFEDAIHLITSLKSVNDTSLSDWRGIIGDELLAQREAQKEEQEHKEQRLREIMEQLVTIERESIDPVGLQEREERERVRTELSALRGDVKVLASQVGGVPFRAISKRKIVEKPCPVCSSVIEVAQGKGRATKKVECPSCNARLYSQVDGAEVYLRERTPIQETLVCPKCSFVETVGIDPLPGTMQEYECGGCQIPLRAVRTKADVSVRVRGTAPSVSSVVNSQPVRRPMPETLLKEIAEKMGPQPWPPGKSHDVRVELGITRQTIDYAIKMLIVQGRFKPQVNGTLYGPIIVEPTQPGIS